MLQPETNVVFPYLEQTVSERGWKVYDGKLPVLDPSIGKRRLFHGVEFEEDEQAIREAKAKEAAEFEKRKNE